MYISHPTFPSRAQRHALARAEARDEADLETLEAIQAILRNALAQLRALPRLEHPDPTYCLEDTIRCLHDELECAAGWADLLARQPTYVEDDWEDAA